MHWGFSVSGNSGKLSIEVLVVNDEVITLAVKKGNEVDWVYSAIFAAPKASHYEELWNCHQKVANVICVPWLLDGDFNQVRGVS